MTPIYEFAEIGKNAVKDRTLILTNPIFFKRAIRFALTGMFVTGVHAVTAIIFINYLLPIPPLANGVAFVSATMVSYVINTTWSFSSPMHGRTLFRFLAVSFLGLMLAIIVAWLAQKMGLNYLLGIGAVALTIPPITFVFHNFWTYR